VGEKAVHLLADESCAEQAAPSHFREAIAGLLYWWERPNLQSPAEGDPFGSWLLNRPLDD